MKKIRVETAGKRQKPQNFVLTNGFDFVIMILADDMLV